MLIFLALTAWIVYRGVEKGIEKFSSFIMPGLIGTDPRDRSVLSDAVPHGCGRHGAHRYAGTDGLI